jgi:hypothetical protein
VQLVQAVKQLGGSALEERTSLGCRGGGLEKPTGQLVGPGGNRNKRRR